MGGEWQPSAAASVGCAMAGRARGRSPTHGREPSRGAGGCEGARARRRAGAGPRTGSAAICRLRLQ